MCPVTSRRQPSPRGHPVGDDLKITLPYATSGIMGGVLLSLGRALGETMAVTMVIGNANVLTLNVFAPGNTMASVIANEFSEATTNVYLSSLIEIGLLLIHRQHDHQHCREDCCESNGGEVRDERSGPT